MAGLFTFLEFTSLLIKIFFSGISRLSANRIWSCRIHRKTSSVDGGVPASGVGGGWLLQHVSASFKASGESGLMWLDTASCRLATPTSGESTVGCWLICHRVCCEYWMHTDPKGAVAEGAGPAGCDKDS
ncbi:uncharacterized protein LOC121467354 [Drosophila elegans]|uniref:uncharacterized protein LOC121467352 n=1 Tax=Drosophila elegans TaxID=30023 RepID=UPI001BC84A0F|nr:uncharacterized protein LOC121467352 [Drosophila elegans]XP_041564669.1 uncharacterized protein LOC121467353 [Drosophila elegans]XP_041564670.1 uncharacterized protein LOC121467354 [Drosophila elegans]